MGKNELEKISERVERMKWRDNKSEMRENFFSHDTYYWG